MYTKKILYPETYWFWGSYHCHLVASQRSNWATCPVTPHCVRTFYCWSRARRSSAMSQLWETVCGGAAKGLHSKQGECRPQCRFHFTEAGHVYIFLRGLHSPRWVVFFFFYSLSGPLWHLPSERQQCWRGTEKKSCNILISAEPRGHAESLNKTMGY